MEEIKVNEYVRTKYGYIAKITEIDNYIWFNQKINKESGMAVYELSKVEFENLVVKHSPNIIDLIEEGDYVNGERVLQKAKIKDGSMQICILKDNNSSNWRTINNFTLKNIVTKEQFNQVKYEV